MTIEVLELLVGGLPRRDMTVLAAWLDGLTRGFVGPITERLAEIEVEIMRHPIEDVLALKQLAGTRLANTEPEQVGAVLDRSIQAIARVLGAESRGRG